jgi:hypothetical protein
MKMDKLRSGGLYILLSIPIQNVATLNASRTVSKFMVSTVMGVESTHESRSVKGDGCP